MVTQWSRRCLVRQEVKGSSLISLCASACANGADKLTFASVRHHVPVARGQRTGIHHCALDGELL